jgi:flagellar FliL protein
VLVVGVAAGAYFSGLLDPLLKGSKTQEKKVETEEEKPKEVQAAVFYDLPEILVNLNTVGRKQSFLKIRVSLELENALEVSKIEQVMPRIIDDFQVYLRELRVEDLQGSAGMLRLREELLSRVNAAVKPAKVNDVLFKEMLVQ